MIRIVRNLSLTLAASALCTTVALAQTAPAANDAAPEITQGMEDIGGPSSPAPSRGYYVAKLTQSGVPNPNFNQGKSLYFYTTLGKTANRYTYASAMTPGRDIMLAGTPQITSIGIQQNGRYSSRYSGIFQTGIQGKTGFNGGRDVSFGDLVDNSYFKSYVAGDVAVKIAEGQFSSVLAVKWVAQPDPTDGHVFGEDGAAYVFPQQLDPDLDDLKTLKMLTADDGGLRVLVHATDKDASGGPAHSLWMIALTSRGVLDRNFGEGGALRLPFAAPAFEQTYSYKPHFYASGDYPYRFFVGKLSQKAGRAHIEIDGYDADTGARIANFVPIDLRIDHGTPRAFELAVNQQRIALVATLPNAPNNAAPRRLIAMFDLFGRPNPNFSGDGKRLVRLENDALMLAAAALSDNNDLYIVETSQIDTSTVGAVSKWRVDDVSQGSRDTTWGQLQPFVSLDQSTLRSQAGEDLGAFKFDLNVADAFIEPLANGAHGLVVTGSAFLKP